jgi:pilus assembly protein CpaC
MTKELRQRTRLEAFLFLAVLLVATAFAGPVWSQPRLTVQSDETRHAGEFIVPINKSQVLQLDVPFSDLLVGNSSIADVLALSDRSVYVLGKALGSTSLTVYGANKTLIAVMDLIVSPDIEGLKARLFEIMPEENIEIRTGNGSVILSGAVSSTTRLSSALAVAERFAPGLITNLLTVEGSQQVMLQVRFVEVSRTVSKDLGLNTDIQDGDFRFTSGDTFLANPAALAGEGGFALFGDTFGAGLFTGSIGGVDVQLLFRALEEKGVAKVLAEPNLIALSGDTAEFLAGGEFPFEVVQSSSAGADPVISIEFKEFGISLSFTPTVLDDGLINLVVSPEVSSLAPGTGDVPALKVRRATTTVELRDGQSFAIAGLIQNDFSDTVRQVPLLGEVPVIGALLRSSGFERNETELVIIVEPHLVKPAPAGALATPADNFIPPSEADIWLLGRVEAPGSGLGGPAGLSASGAGGIEGPYGHIIK